MEKSFWKVEEPLVQMLPKKPRPELYRVVEVASVVVARVIRASVSVEEALEMKPAVKSRVVEVACSLVPSLVKGHRKVIEAR